MQACQDAHSQAMTWLAGSDFVANSVLAFFMVRALCLSCTAHPALGLMPPCNGLKSLEPVAIVAALKWIHS